MYSKVRHVGIIVKDMEQAINTYTNVLGFNPPIYRRELPELGFKNAMLRLGDFGIEFLETTDPDNDLGRFLAKNGEGLFHICLVVDDVDAEIEDLKARGADMLVVPPSESAPYKRVFIRRRSANGVLIEFSEESD